MTTWSNKKHCCVCSEWKGPEAFDSYPSIIINADNWCRECMSKRDISPRQEEIIRLRHHDLGFCHTQKETADELGLSISDISDAENQVRKIMEKLRIKDFFPILTELEAEACSCYINEDMIQAQIATYLTSLKYLGSVSKNSVTQAIGRARAKGFYVPKKRFRGPGKMVRYNPDWMDRFIKRQF